MKEEGTLKAALSEPLFITLLGSDPSGSVSSPSDVSSSSSPLQQWPSHFEIPELPYDTEVNLESVNAAFRKVGTFFKNLIIKSDILYGPVLCTFYQ